MKLPSLSRLFKRVDKQPNILIIDDKPAEILLLEKALKKSYPGIPFTSLQSFEECLTHIAKIATGKFKCPTLLLIDKHMPKVKGEEIGRAFKSVCPNCKIIIHSGEPTKAPFIQDEIEVYQCDATIRKTVNFTSTMAHIGHLLNLKPA